jgi:spermidine synthase
MDPRRRRHPTAYYGRSSGAGLVLAEAEPGDTIGVAGLGVGTLACYRKPGQEWTFFEIDALVVRYSRDRTFTFVADCAPGARIAVGDARLQLEREPLGRFDVLLIDAFTSDAIPLHLLTVEAFATYRRALAADGLLLVHISNRFIDLEPMIAALARAGGWHALIRRDALAGVEGLSASDWVALAPDAGRLDRLEASHPEAWDELRPAVSKAWTDDRASFVSLIRF